VALGFLALALGACSSKDVQKEPVASVNGEEVRVGELREFLGYRGGAAQTVGIPAERKKEGLDRMIDGRLLVQDAKARGIDNTVAYREAVAKNEQGVWIGALLRKEAASKLKIRDDEVKAEAKKAREADKNLSEADATMRAAQSLLETQMRKIEQDLVAAAKKEFPGTIDRDALERIGKGEPFPDNAVLATAGPSKVTYAETMRFVQGAVQGGHGAEQIARNPAALGQILERELTGMSLEAYAKKQGLEGTEAMKSVRLDMERSVAINLLAEQVLAAAGEVTDQEIQAAYAGHEKMFVRDGKKIPLAQVKDQLRRYLQDGKRRKALEEHIAGLRKNAKITVNEGALAKV
jgi:hypothetical protein